MSCEANPDKNEFQATEINQDKPWKGTKTLNLQGHLVRKNPKHQIPDRLKLVFSNSVLDDSYKFSYLHECSKIEKNIFKDMSSYRFKVDIENIPPEFDNVPPHRRTFPRPGTNLKDNFILEGTLFGVYDSTLNCPELMSKSGINVTSFVRSIRDNIQPGPNKEFAMNDQYNIFYRRGSLDNIMAKDNSKNDSLVTMLDLYRSIAKETGRPKYECLADWISKIPEGFSCARAVSSVRERCQEIYEPTDCSNMLVKVASKESCGDEYRLKECPEKFMADEHLRAKYCEPELLYDEDSQNSYPYEPTGKWVIYTRRRENYNCCCSENDCCNGCFSAPYLGL